MRAAALLLIACALAGCGAGDVRPTTDAADAPVDPARALVDAAIEAAGGRAALERSPVLEWSGDATVHLRDQHIAIGVDTVLRPDGRSKSKSWRVEQGE